MPETTGSASATSPRRRPAADPTTRRPSRRQQRGAAWPARSIPGFQPGRRGGGRDRGDRPGTANPKPTGPPHSGKRPRRHKRVRAAGLAAGQAARHILRARLEREIGKQAAPAWMPAASPRHGAGRPGDRRARRYGRRSADLLAEECAWAGRCRRLPDRGDAVGVCRSGNLGNRPRPVHENRARHLAGALPALWFALDRPAGAGQVPPDSAAGSTYETSGGRAGH